jgi:hypothetical protein
MRKYSLKIGILGMCGFTATVFIIIQYVCIKIDKIFNLPYISRDVSLLIGIILLVIGGYLHSGG